MARSDLLVDLVDAERNGDRERSRRLVKHSSRKSDQSSITWRPTDSVS